MSQESLAQTKINVTVTFKHSGGTRWIGDYRWDGVPRRGDGLWLNGDRYNVGTCNWIQDDKDNFTVELEVH